MDGEDLLDGQGDGTLEGRLRLEMGDGGSGPERSSGDVGSEPAELTREDLTIATLVGARLTHARIGEMLGISTKSVQRRVRKVGMAQAIADARGSQLAELTASVIAMSSKAVAVVERVMDSEDERVALSAAKAALSTAHRLSRAEADADLAARVLDLEVAEAHALLGGRPRRRPASAGTEEN